MTLELYPASVHDAFHGTGIQYPAHIDEAVQQIHGACKGLGTDEQTLIAVLGSKSPETRNLIALRYKELYRQPLKSLLKSETSGDFGRLLRMISTPLPETEAQILRDATKGIGTTESLIVQILSGRSNEEMNILKRTYFDLVGKDLAVTLNSELSGDFRKVVMAILQSPQVAYNQGVHNAAKAEEEAIALYKAGQGRLGTNEEAFIGILVKAPPEFLKMMDAVYVAKYNNNIVKAVEKEFSGDAKKSLSYLVRSTLDPYSTIAEVFEKTMKGFGTDETGLSTTLVRYQSVLPHVKSVYKRLYHEELRDRISGETSGDFKKLLLEMFDAPQDPPRMKIKGAYGAGVTAGSNVPAYLSTQTSYAASSSGFNAASTGSPAYLSNQTSYATTGAGLPSSSQGYGAPSAYPTPTVTQSYGQPAPSQAEYRTAPYQTQTSQPVGYPSQPSNSQPYPSSGSSYTVTQAQGQPPGYPSPQSSYPSQQQYPQPASGLPPQSGYQQQQAPPAYSPQPLQQQPSYGAPPHSGYQQQQLGYPTQQQYSQPAAGFPPQSGYPHQQAPPTHPTQPLQHQPSYNAPSHSSYQQQQPGYPTQQPSYPQQQQYPQPGSGFPPQSGYQQQQALPTYPPQPQQQQSSYGAPPHSGYQQQQPGYPTQQPSYPQQQPGYPPQQPNYQQQPGNMAPQGYPPTQHPSHPYRGV